MAQQFGLGRGLDALIARKIAVSPSPLPVGQGASTSAVDRDATTEIPIMLIDANEYQPRQDFHDEDLEELAQSIREYGVIQPLIVSRVGDRFQLIAGERRLRASKIVGLERVPVVFRNADEHQRLAVAIIENIQRVDLNGIELAIAYRRLLDEFNVSQEALSKRLGKSRPTITNVLRLLTLPEEIQEAVRSGKINYTFARTILSIPDPEQQMRFYKDMGGKPMATSLASDVARDYSKKERTFRNSTDSGMMHKETILREYLGTRVVILKKGNGGMINIEFYSNDELAAIVNRIIQE